VRWSEAVDVAVWVWLAFHRRKGGRLWKGEENQSVSEYARHGLGVIGAQRS
jgi:hypothetical protein